MRRKWRKPKPKPEKKIISNERIQAETVFLISDEGEKIGETPTREALQKAREEDADLVLVNPKADPPVAKITDLGRLKYESEKKAHKQKMQQKKVETKSIRLSVRISKHDFDFRINQAKKFLDKGNKLKLELTLKGREKQHPEKARETLQRFVEEIKTDENYEVAEEQPLTKQGGRYTIILVNKK